MSFLQILDSSLLESHFEITDVGKLPATLAERKKVNITESALNVVAEAGDDATIPGHHICKVTVSTKENYKDLFFKLKVVMVGVFTISPEFFTKKNADPDKLILITGASMLYSAVREHVLMLTLRSATPGVQLPAVTFSDNIKTHPNLKPVLSEQPEKAPTA